MADGRTTWVSTPRAGTGTAARGPQSSVERRGVAVRARDQAARLRRGARREHRRVDGDQVCRAASGHLRGDLVDRRALARRELGRRAPRCRRSCRALDFADADALLAQRVVDQRLPLAPGAVEALLVVVGRGRAHDRRAARRSCAPRGSRRRWCTRSRCDPPAPRASAPGRSRRPARSPGRGTSASTFVPTRASSSTSFGSVGSAGAAGLSGSTCWLQPPDLLHADAQAVAGRLLAQLRPASPPPRPPSGSSGWRAPAPIRRVARSSVNPPQLACRSGPARNRRR